MFALNTENSIPFDPWELIPTELRINLGDFKAAVDIALQQAMATGDEENALFWLDKLGAINEMRSRLVQRSTTQSEWLAPYREVLTIPNPVDREALAR